MLSRLREQVHNGNQAGRRSLVLDRLR